MKGDFMLLPEMKLPPDFKEKLREKTDHQLYDMLAEADDYLPEAIEAVLEEWNRRNLPLDRVEQIRADRELRITEEASMDEERHEAALGAKTIVHLFHLVRMFFGG